MSLEDSHPVVAEEFKKGKFTVSSPKDTFHAEGLTKLISKIMQS